MNSTIPDMRGPWAAKKDGPSGVHLILDRDRRTVAVLHPSAPPALDSDGYGATLDAVSAAALAAVPDLLTQLQDARVTLAELGDVLAVCNRPYSALVADQEAERIERLLSRVLPTRKGGQDGG